MTRTGLWMARWRRPLLILLVVAAMVVPAAPASAKHKKAKSSEPATIVVKLEPGRSPDSLLSEFDLRLAGSLLPSRGLYEMGTADGEQVDKKTLDKLVKEIERRSGVEWVEVDEGQSNARDDRFYAWPEGAPQQIGRQVSDYFAQPALDDLHLDEAHRVSTGEGIVVAVLDTGADMDHPYLEDHLAARGHYDYVDDDIDPGERENGIDDDGDGRVDEAYGHGTHTAGLVALVAPDADIMVFRVLNDDGSGNPYVVAQAIEDAIAEGADVISLSFGMEGKPKSKIVKDAFKLAKKAEVPVVAAVGNKGDESAQFPADDKYVIGVAAIGLDKTGLADFSNHGKPALVAAPGEDVVSTLPGGRFGAWSGTSMATPIVAGQVALLRAEYPKQDLKKVTDLLGKNVIKLKSKNKVEKGKIDLLRSLGIK